jgi:two-component system chemotaxis response regulator CheY
VVSSAAEKSSFGETKVLVVDDEYRVRKVIQGLLLGLNCTKIHEARNGAEALEHIVVLAPDVILLDWTLPDMSGPEFLRRLHSSLPADISTAPAIMLVERDQRACVLEAVRFGVHEFLLKPVSITALRERLASVLAKSLAVKRAHEAARQLRKVAG